MAVQVASHTASGSCSSGTLQLRYQASYWRQLAVLSRRLGKATWVDPMLLAMNWGAALLMALGLGIVYWHATRDTGQLCCPFHQLRRMTLLMRMCVCSNPLLQAQQWQQPLHWCA